MNELRESKFKYKIIREDSDVIIEAENEFRVESVIYDTKNDNWIIAIWGEDVEYIYLSKEFEIIKVLLESEGVIPHLIKGIDDTIWVTLASTSTEKDGEIVLPLENRGRIQKSIVKKDIGIDYFIYNNRSYGYIEDIFESEKESHIAIYEYDKNSVYKNRKMVKLTNVNNGFPVVINEDIYFATTKWKKENSKVVLYKINASFETEKICEVQIETVCRVILVGIEEKYFTVMNIIADVIKIFDINYAGEIIGEKEVYKLNPEVLQVRAEIGRADYSLGCIYTTMGNYTFLYKKGKVVVCKETDEEKSLVPINDKYFIATQINRSRRLVIRKFNSEE